MYIKTTLDSRVLVSEGLNRLELYVVCCNSIGVFLSNSSKIFVDCRSNSMGVARQVFTCPQGKDFQEIPGFRFDELVS